MSNPLLLVERDSDSSTHLAQILSAPPNIRDRYVDKLRHDALSITFGDYMLVQTDNGALSTVTAANLASQYTVLDTYDPEPLDIKDTVATPSRSEGTFGPISSTRWAHVRYRVPLTLALTTLGGGGEGRVDLYTGTGSPPTFLADSARHSLAGSLNLSNVTIGCDLVVEALVPPGHSVKIDLVDVSGSPTWGSIAAVERLL